MKIRFFNMTKIQILALLVNHLYVLYILNVVSCMYSNIKYVFYMGSKVK